MEKLTGLELAILAEGLVLYSNSLKKEIKGASKKGKVHLFTDEYVDSTVSEIRRKLKTLTLKE